MTSHPWMPLYIAQYLADTAHLDAAEHGAYLLLIMHYWQKGKLPDDDAQLARIARMSLTEWRKCRKTIKSFFAAGWRHKRIDRELRRAAIISETNSKKAREAANRRWLKHNQNQSDACVEHDPSNACSSPQAMLGDAHRQRKQESKKEPIQEEGNLSSSKGAEVVRLDRGRK